MLAVGRERDAIDRPSCPGRSSSCVPSASDQSRTLRSLPQVATVLAVGADGDRRGPSPDGRGSRGSAWGASRRRGHQISLPSVPPVSSVWPSGETARAKAQPSCASKRDRLRLRGVGRRGPSAGPCRPRSRRRHTVPGRVEPAGDQRLAVLQLGRDMRLLGGSGGHGSARASSGSGIGQSERRCCRQ